MAKYLFLILDRYESSLSKSFEIKTKLLDPRLVFRNCMLEKAGDGTNEHEEFYNEEVADQVCRKDNFTTYDGEEQSFILIKLEN